jgi:flavodoxin
MTANEVHLIYFSPTHTSKQVGEAIVRGTGITNVINTNLTQQATQDLVIAESALAIIVVPVYGGRVAPLAMDRLASVRGSNTPAVIVVVYGNRAYEKSLMELDYWAIQQGFKVIAGATFIGEHSYSTEKYPVAAGRPDERDLAVAADFGKQISDKIASATEPAVVDEESSILSDIDADDDFIPIEDLPSEKVELPTELFGKFESTKAEAATAPEPVAQPQRPR